ncbi:SDR family NAD(P)-dependent oxidoreductase [Streptomyces luteolus]|uniref:SDR family oxidoreductase n=1 Tax=Streptomyces luteolus TaxID=3043615 RepID=A0ABT6SVS4_9ACTN|nr:SDR family oxidoreductase [Streptomyces sp. B-S-A12]MDI3418737.1 SDR family oxidoreductase [Streptomyces sp. B-S-A12]
MLETDTPATANGEEVPSLAGRTVLVTGATGDGVGAGVCRAVQAAGGRLVLNGLTEAELAPVLKRHPGAVGVVGDVSKPEDAERIVRTATERCGPVTALVNNAGVGLAEPFYRASEEEFDRVFDVDVRGLWLVSRAFSRLLIDQGMPGAIVNVSSVHGRATMDQYAIYASAKSAVDGLTRGSALELGPYGVRCNAIAPGYVHSEQNVHLLGRITDDPEAWVERHRDVEQPLPRLVEPVDCGWAAVFLLSEQSRCVTGQTLYVDAGLTARLYNRASTGNPASAPATVGGPLPDAPDPSDGGPLPTSDLTASTPLAAIGAPSLLEGSL